MMKNKSLRLAFMAAITLIAGCATILSGTTQAVHVQAIDAKTHHMIPGASCTVKDGQGGVYKVPGNPGTITVTKNRGALNVVCRARGWHQKATGVGQSFNAWTIANVVFFWPGVLVDAATGAIEKYPSHITVIMEKRHK